MEQQNLTATLSQDETEAPTSLWRDEVQARVAGYRSRRGRRIEGAFSMRFPFPPAEAAPSAPLAEPESECASESSPPIESVGIEVIAESASPERAATDRFKCDAINPQPQPEMVPEADASIESREID